MCVFCVCVFFPFILDIKFVGRTSRGHTGFLIHLPSAVRALIFLARRTHTFLFLVDRDVEFCVFMCVFSSHSFWASSSLDVPAGVTEEEGHTGFFIRFPSALRALIFLERRIQPFLSLVDREVEFCVLTYQSFSTRWAFFFFFFF